MTQLTSEGDRRILLPSNLKTDFTGLTLIAVPLPLISAEISKVMACSEAKHADAGRIMVAKVMQMQKGIFMGA